MSSRCNCVNNCGRNRSLFYDNDCGCANDTQNCGCGSSGAGNCGCESNDNCQNGCGNNSCGGSGCNNGCGYGLFDCVANGIGKTAYRLVSGFDQLISGGGNCGCRNRSCR